MAEERERRQVGETDELSEDKAAEPDVEAHTAALDRGTVDRRRTDDGDDEADEGRERRK